jgi:hypothetical protein
VLISSCCATPSGGIGAFGGIITKGFGFVSPPVSRMNSTDTQTSLNAILMQIPTGVLGIIILLVSIWLTNKYKLRFPVIAYVVSSGRSLAQADQVVESAYSLLLEQQL